MSWLGLIVTIWLGFPGPKDSSAFPQGKWKFRVYGAEQGLNNLAAKVILQDHLGFIWVGTEAGLYRWDGSYFESFGMGQGLPSSEIIHLIEDRQGWIWIATKRGLACWDGKEILSSPGGLPDTVINKLACHDRLLVATQMGPFELTKVGFVPVRDWPGGECTSIFAPSQVYSMVAAAWNKGTSILTRDHESWISMVIPEGMSQERIDGLVVDSSNRIWARAARSLWVKRENDKSFQRAETPFEVLSSKGYLRLGTRGDLWLPTDNGLGHFQNDTWSFLDGGQGLPFSWSRDAMEDREGTLWIASSGVVRLLGRGVWQSYTIENNLPTDVIWCLFRDRANAIWVGTDVGLALATGTTWEPQSSTAKMAVRSIAQGSDHTLYLAGYPANQLGLFNMSSGELKHIPLGVEPLPRRNYRLLVDEKNRIWVATDGSGLLRADGADALHFERVSFPDGIHPNSVNDVRQDELGRIWCATDQGLGVLHKDQTWQFFGLGDGLLKKEVFCGMPLDNGGILVSYSEPVGLTFATLDGNQFSVNRHLGSGSKLGEQRVYITGQDTLGRLWVGTGGGVDLLGETGFEHFGLAEGLVGEDCDNMAFLSGSNGDVWIGTSTGLARFDNAAYQGPVMPPRSSFLTIRLGDQTFFPDDHDVQVEKTENSFEARFAGLSFVNEKAVTHQIRMVGLDPDWVTTEFRVARYPALQHGQYRFDVRARVGPGKWGPATSFDFEILPGWRQTWWFRSVVILSIAGLIYLLVRWRLASLKQQNIILEKQVAERTLELMSSNLALEKANEALKTQSLTDPLTGLRNRRYLGECMPEFVAQVNRTHRDLTGKNKDRIGLNVDILFIMVDVDHFKSVNDTYGHSVGDLVLRQVSHILEVATRDSDTLVRWGGEEFLVVARNACRQDYATVVERIRSQIEQWEFDIGLGKTIRKTCSLGFAFFPLIPGYPEHMVWERVVGLADQCLYAAKHSGRNAWVGLIPHPEIKGFPEAIKQTNLEASVLIENKWFLPKTSLDPNMLLDWGQPRSSKF